MSHADKWTAQFYGKETPCIKSESSAEAGYTKSTQTCNNASVSVDMSEIGHSKLCLKLTSTRTWCWETVYAICWWNVHVQFKAKRMLQRVNDFVIGMMRLRFEFLVKHLEFIFQILRVPMCFEKISDNIIVLDCTKNLFKVHCHWRTNILPIQATQHTLLISHWL